MITLLFVALALFVGFIAGALTGIFRPTTVERKDT